MKPCEEIGKVLPFLRLRKLPIDVDAGELILVGKVRHRLCQSFALFLGDDGLTGSSFPNQRTFRIDRTP